MTRGSFGDMHLVVSDEVLGAVSTGSQGVVALESTIISHGLPYPENLHTARLVERVVRENGAIPATIAILNGVIRVGLSDAELEQLASGKFPNVSKVSRRDIASVVACGGNGSTTVAATMIIARMAGIKIFATGGIGGVHRGAEESWDVSADLSELGRTPVLVVSAGAKSILDLPKTLEVLETMGVPVVGFRTQKFPAFFTPDSGLSVSSTCSSEKHMAEILETHFSLGLKNGILLACPVPTAGDAKKIEAATAEAVADAKKKCISGKDVTPFILKHVHQATKGDSLRANISLITNNAGIAARIATELQKKNLSGEKKLPPPPSPIQIIGAIGLDTVAVPDDTSVSGSTGSSFPGTIRQSVGGVGRNIAKTIYQLGTQKSINFLSVIGKDSNQYVTCEAEACGWTLVRSPAHRTAQYCAVMNGDGSLCSGVADMSGIFTDWKITQDQVDLTRKKLLILETNLSRASILETARHADLANVPVWIDGVSVVKCPRLIPAILHLELLKLNLDELAVVVGHSAGTAMTHLAREFYNKFAVKANFKLLVTMGKHGAALIEQGAPNLHHASLCISIDATTSVLVNTTNFHNLRITRFTAPPITDAIDSTGAGDSFLGATAWAHAVEGISVEKAIIVGMLAARLTLMSPLAVAEGITHDRFKELTHRLEFSNPLSHQPLSKL